MIDSLLYLLLITGLAFLVFGVAMSDVTSILVGCACALGAALLMISWSEMQKREDERKND